MDNVKLIPADLAKPMRDFGNVEPPLKEMQKAVGGYIEYVDLNRYNEETGERIGKFRALIVNEEGKLHGLPVNHRATNILHDRYPGHTDIIVGDALFFDGVEME